MGTAIRGLWILNETGQLVLSRRFPTVEKKQQLVSSSICNSNISSMIDAIFVKTYMQCLEKVISDQLSNECYLIFALKLQQKKIRQQQHKNETTDDLEDTMSSVSDDLHSYDSDQEDSMEELMIWPFVAIVVGGISLITLPFMDTNDCKTFVEFYKSQMTELQKKESQVFHFTNTFRRKSTITTHRLPFSSHQNNNESTKAFDLIELPCITGAFCLLQDLSSTYFLAQKQTKPTTQQFQHLDPGALYIHMFLSQCMPFGRPLETSPINIHQLMSKPLPAKMDSDTWSSRKRPAWRSHELQIPQDKQRISFIIRETINSVQYDKPKIADTWSCQGSVICSADVSGFPDISVQLSNLEHVNNFSAHRCCSQYPQALHPNNPFTLTFSPPPGGFVLCKYNVCDETTTITSNTSNNVSLPLRGYYQMREFEENDVDAVELIVQLKLEKASSNNFEYCNIYIPFPNKPIINEFKLTQAPVGQVTKSNSGHALIWKLGTRFKSKNLEVILATKVYFHSALHTQVETKSERKKDPLLVNTNAYIKLNYKILDNSVSGLIVDPKSVFTSPASHFSQVHVKQEVIANNCMIWNSIAENVRHVIR
jgi:AP-5 complex subunit mu-1